MILRPTYTGPRPRGAFTLIEMLVVIAIIGVLIALLLGAVQQVRVAADRTETFSAIHQIDVAIGEFKSKYKVSYIPPGPFTLKNQYSGSEPELVFLTQVWPQLNYSNTGLIPNGSLQTYAVLDSNQTLAFFLTGGATTGMNGFSTNPQYPFSAGNPGDVRVGPFLKLPSTYYSNGVSTVLGNAGLGLSISSVTCQWQTSSSGKSVAVPITLQVGQQVVPKTVVYLPPWIIDKYGVPYAYFVSLNAKNNMYCAPPEFTTDILNTPVSGGVPNWISQAYAVDLSGTTYTITPYYTGTPWTGSINGQGFQIISAGKDLKFGVGGSGIPAVGHGVDDIANFSSTVLGGGIN